jgi:hypothetical protein
LAPLLLQVLAVHLRRVVKAPTTFGLPVGALALSTAAVSVHRVVTRVYEANHTLSGSWNVPLLYSKPVPTFEMRRHPTIPATHSTTIPGVGLHASMPSRLASCLDANGSKSCAQLRYTLVTAEAPQLQNLNVLQSLQMVAARYWCRMMRRTFRRIRGVIDDEHYCCFSVYTQLASSI